VPVVLDVLVKTSCQKSKFKPRINVKPAHFVKFEQFFQLSWFLIGLTPFSEQVSLKTETAESNLDFCSWEKCLLAKNPGPETRLFKVSFFHIL
jgi:hypothetical protein